MPFPILWDMAIVGKVAPQKRPYPKKDVINA